MAHFKKLISVDNKNSIKLNTESQYHLFKLQIKARKMSSFNCQIPWL